MLLREHHIVFPAAASPAAFWRISTPELLKIQLEQELLRLLDPLMLAEPQPGGPGQQVTVDQSDTRAVAQRTCLSGSTVQARIQCGTECSPLQRHLWLGRGKKQGCILHSCAEVPRVPKHGQILACSCPESPGSEHRGAASGRLEEPKVKSSSSFEWDMCQAAG